MAWDTAKKILDEAAINGVNSIKTNFRGESSINPNFERITEYAKSWHNKLGGSVFIDRLSNTNFKFRSDREDIFRGFSNQTKVKISYDSFDKKVFETQRAGGDHELTTRNIDIFYNHPSRIHSGTRMVIQAVRTQLNKDEDIAGQAKVRWPDATISIRDMVAGRVENKEVGELEHKKRDVSGRAPCLQAFVRLMFHWDGKAGICCPDISGELIVGDIKNQSLKQIFNSPKAKTVRKKLKDLSAFKDYSACKNCSSFESYKGFKPVWDS